MPRGNEYEWHEGPPEEFGVLCQCVVFSLVPFACLFLFLAGIGGYCSSMPTPLERSECAGEITGKAFDLLYNSLLWVVNCIASISSAN